MSALRLADIRTIDIRLLDPLLAEETLEWKLQLDWDFSSVAALIRRLAREGRLSGAALMDGAEVAGCGYVALQANKGQIVNAWVRPRWRGTEAEPEARLLRALFGALVATPGVSRVETQLMLLKCPVQPVRGIQVRTFDRLLMKRSTSAALSQPEKPLPPGIRIESWTTCHLEAAARLLSASRAGHIDRELNDEYVTAAGATRIIRSMIEFEHGGTFCEPASFLAFDERTGRMAGLLLAAFVAEGAGHIGELSVAPEAQGRGVGRELLRCSIDALQGFGADRVSLAVTAANSPAVAFYRGWGFREFRRFKACVWEREPPLTAFTAFTFLTSESRSTATLSPSPDS